MSKHYLHNDETLFGRSVDDYLLYEGGFFTDKEAHEFDDKYIVEVSVPGFKPDKLDLRVEGDTLILRGFEITKQQRLFWTNIIKIPVFQRSLLLPIDAASNTISAQYKPGVVKVVCPKQMVPLAHHKSHYLVQTRKIKIQEITHKKGWFLQLMQRFRLK